MFTDPSETGDGPEPNDDDVDGLDPGHEDNDDIDDEAAEEQSEEHDDIRYDRKAL